MFPIEAAVMPLPREETTPPVTKTYFDMDDLQGGFTNCTGWRRRPPPALLSRFGFRLQYDDLRLPLRVVIRRKTDDAHAGDLVLAGSLDLVSALAHRLRVGVVVVVVADGQQVSFLARQAQPDRGWVGVGDHRRALASQPEASMS